MKEHYFIDNIHIMTDYMGGWENQFKVVGWYDCKTDKYFNPDEVKELFYQGEAENVGISEDGTLYMENCWLDVRTAFSIICGIPFGVDNKHLNLVNYAYKMGWATQYPTSIKMFSGTKFLIINQNHTYTIKYVIDKEKYVNPCVEFIEKICVGAIKSLELSDNCGEISFDKNNLSLIIHGIPYHDVYQRILIDRIRDLDLELLISNPNIVNFSNVLHACKDWCRDCGQYHWIKENPIKDAKKSNVYWYDK